MNPDAFHFLRPAWLLALALLAPLAWWWRKQRSDAGGWSSVCEPHLLPHLLVPGRGRAAAAPFALLALGWSGACLAMAGPTWERLPQPVFGDPTRTVFVLSLAPSMDADDVAPSRLARARYKLGDALDRLGGGSVGLVVFREEAYAAVPLTDDAGVVREMLSRLRTDLAPGREVLPSRGLAEARRLLEAEGASGARVVLVSDGSDARPEATLDAARDLAKDGATVSVLSLAPGDAPGLAALASAGGGSLAKLTAGDADLERLLAPRAPASLATRLSRSELEADAWWDAGAWLVWIPLLLGALAFRRGWLVAAVALAWIGLPSAPAQAAASDWFQRPDQRGAQAFEAGRYAESAESFENPAWRAAALYRAGDFDRAAELLEPQDDALSQYNLGNALARAGRLEDALAAYDRSLAAAPGDDDARWNRDLVKRLLDQQQKQQQQQQRDEGSQGGGSGDRAAKSGRGDEQKAGGGAADEPSEGGSKADDEHASRPDPQRADAGDRSDASGSEAPDRDGGAQPQREPGSAGEEQQPSAADASPATPGEQSADASSGSGAAGRDAEGAHAADGAPPDAHGATDAAPPGATDARPARDPWLAHLPDDPGGLLREKLRRDYLRKREARLRGELP